MTFSREEKEKWIQSKYKLKEFLPPLPFDNVPYTQVVYVIGNSRVLQ